jgi:hypothetical protein
MESWCTLVGLWQPSQFWRAGRRVVETVGRSYPTIMPHSSFACSGFSAIACSVDMRPMWHSTQRTSAWNEALCASVSSGCTEWQVLAQKASLFEYSQATIPPAPSSASATPPSTIVAARPIEKMRCFIARASRAQERTL